MMILFILHADVMHAQKSCQELDGSVLYAQTLIYAIRVMKQLSLGSDINQVLYEGAGKNGHSIDSHIHLRIVRNESLL